MRLRVGEIERPAERVAQFVVQGHGGAAEARAAQPGAVLGLRTCLGVLGVGVDDHRKRRGERADAFQREQAEDGVAVGRVEGFDGVRDGVDAACGGEADGQGHGVVDVVDYRAGQDGCVRSGRFDAVLGLAEDGRHFASGVGRWDADVRQAGADGERFT